MTSEDWAWTGIALSFIVPILLGGLILLFLSIRSFKKARRILLSGSGIESSKNLTLARLSLASMGVGLFLMLHFWTAGGPNSGKVLDGNNGYSEIHASLIFFILGFLPAFIIKPLVEQPLKIKRSSKLDKYPPLGWVRHHKFISILLFLTVLITGLFVYEKVALVLQRRAFQQARIAIDTVYANIVKNVGPPDNSKRQSECSKSYFGAYKLIISCSVNNDFVYGVKNKEDADKLTTKIRMTINEHPELLRTNSAQNTGVDTNPAPGYENTSSSYDYFKTKDGLLCIFKYVYDNPSETYLKLQNHDDSKTFYVTSGCTGNAKEQYYPLQGTLSS